MGQLYATDAETVWRFRFMIPFEGLYPTTFTGQLKFCTISACWPMTHVSAWMSRSVRFSPSSVSTALTHMVLTMDTTDHSQRIICLFNAGFLLLVEGVAVPGDSVDDFMTATIADTCFTSSYVVPPPLNLTFSSAGLCPLSCPFLYSAALCS